MGGLMIRSCQWEDGKFHKAIYSNLNTVSLKTFPTHGGYTLEALTSLL